MIRLVSKTRSKAGRIRNRLGSVLPILLTGLLVSFLAWGASYLFGLFRYVPAVRIRGVFSGDLFWKIAPQYVLIITTFVLGVLVGTWYFVYRPNRETVQGYWQQVPTWLQATTIGFVGASLLTLTLVVIQTYWLVSDLSVLFTLLISWPVITGIFVLRSRCIVDDDCDRSTSIRIGYLHARGLESRTMSVIVGSLFAVLGGFVTWLTSIRVADWDSVLLATSVALLLWILVTVLVYNRYDAQTSELTDLTISDINQPDNRKTWEMAIKNESNETIDLSLAKIRDTKFDLYQFGVDTDLGPGAVCTFNAPEEFRLAPTDDSWELPLGYTLKQGSDTPVILTQTGKMYALQRDGVEAVGGDIPGSTGANHSDMTDSSESNSHTGQDSGTDPSPQD
ncbi:hypothetical protein C478_18046 [Natrinema thermotolerans DSM 11552]|nr:hypothetical protein C478_18046 [Natrinema thermotolerans DSM 11552]